MFKVILSELRLIQLAFDRLEDEESLGKNRQSLRSPEPSERLSENWLFWERATLCCILVLTLDVEDRVKFVQDMVLSLMAWAVLVLLDFHITPSQINFSIALDISNEFIWLLVLYLCRLSLIEMLECKRKLRASRLSLSLFLLILLIVSPGSFIFG